MPIIGFSGAIRFRRCRRVSAIRKNDHFSLLLASLGGIFPISQSFESQHFPA